MPAVALLFAAGSRPDLPAINALADSSGAFAVTMEGDPDEADEGELWAELLVNGLTFDLRGLAPGKPADTEPGRSCVGIRQEDLDAEAEAIVLSPGPHLAGGSMMVPVLRSLAALAAALSELGNVVALTWCPASNLCAPDFFAQQVARWVEGGVFPGLVLVSLNNDPDGGLTSQGLAQFSGQELRVEPELGESIPELAKLALRLIDFLVRQGKLSSEEVLTAPDGQPLRLTPSKNGRYLRVWRG
ncbi:hypothetical protein [Paraurantiacibacter namhicola]|uniref:hypothetical protein n=1 Tax=Paraurantiacibacter namhicola TaxID=645517 RepID=UPI000837A5B5|nr:hypothetical protein [Paraurantiacibacter namhicola]